MAIETIKEKAERLARERYIAGRRYGFEAYKKAVLSCTSLVLCPPNYPDKSRDFQIGVTEGVLGAARGEDL